jgi:hypothetical protein
LEGSGRGLILRYYPIPELSMGDWEKSRKPSVRIAGRRGRDFNPTPSEYEAGVSTTRLRPSVVFALCMPKRVTHAKWQSRLSSPSHGAHEHPWWKWRRHLWIECDVRTGSTAVCYPYWTINLAANYLIQQSDLKRDFKWQWCRSVGRCRKLSPWSIIFNFITIRLRSQHSIRWLIRPHSDDLAWFIV